MLPRLRSACQAALRRPRRASHRRVKSAGRDRGGCDAQPCGLSGRAEKAGKGQVTRR
jgi:hypothetical protein